MNKAKKLFHLLPSPRRNQAVNQMQQFMLNSKSNTRVDVAALIAVDDATALGRLCEFAGSIS